MVGKMHRPLQVHNLTDGRKGFSILHKYKSNFGGFFNFTQEVSLVHSPRKKEERVDIHFKGLEIPVIVITNNKTDAGRKTVHVHANEKIEIYEVRKMSRPENIRSTKELTYTLPVKEEHVIARTSEKEAPVMERITIILQPIVYLNEEYMILKVETRLPVFVCSETKTSVQSLEWLNALVE